jgi:cell division septation protein DedD
MTDRMTHEREDRGLSARQLVLVFLGIVTVCAVFFAAGFLVGYNERASKDLPSTERVNASPSVIPPTVNPPLKSQSEESSAPPRKAHPMEPAPLRAPSTRPVAPPAEARHEAPPSRPAAPQEAATEGTYVLQVAASSSSKDAAAVAKGLKARGFPAFVVSPQQAGAGDQLYRVQIGPYPTREAAEQVKPRLEQAGFKAPFIKH